VSANIASLRAGFDAMGRRCGEQLGESLREMAQAQQAQLEMPNSGPPPTESPPPAIAAPPPRN
jgi:membrane protease subunit (stomatin/prohibitin family)